MPSTITFYSDSSGIAPRDGDIFGAFVYPSQNFNVGVDRSESGSFTEMDRAIVVGR